MGERYNETKYADRRDVILGDDWLMLYCLEVAGRLAIEKGDDTCRELLDNLDCALMEGLRADCGDDPKAMVEKLLGMVF